MKTKQKQKQVSIGDYIETYCQEKRLRERSAVYISPEMHRNLKRAAGLFSSEHYTTASSLADSILKRHFEEFEELLSDVRSEILDRFGKRKQGKSEEPEEQPEDVEIKPDLQVGE